MYSTASAYSYSSSPPSSPATYIDSSSPPSSPAPDPRIQDEDDIPPLSLVHPFAASAKANWQPPQYEKKRAMSPITPPSTVKKARYNQPIVHTQSSPTTSTFLSSPASIRRLITAEEIEARIWDEASTKVVDESHGAVNLDPSLKIYTTFTVPPQTSELINLILQPGVPSPTRPLSRVATAPPSNAENIPRFLQRARSAAAISFGLPREKLQLFLSTNSISSLPLSLFSLQNLTVLSLRNNRLKYIPPEIVGLKNLQELNIAQNKIEYLPAEMLQMTLKTFYVYPNSFIDPSSSSDRYSLRSSTLSQNRVFQRRPVSNTEHMLPRVLPLVELLLRALVSPSGSAMSSETMLDRYYQLPLAEDLENPVELPSLLSAKKIRFTRRLPPAIRSILHACLPGSVYLEEDSGRTSTSTSDICDMTGVGICPSPKHQRLGTTRIFVRPAEERFSWERTVAGYSMSGTVPVRWRGCQRGCLDFLDPPKEAQHPAVDVSDVSLNDADIDMIEGEDMDEVVQVFQLDTSTPGRLDDFGD
ncbi:hypothetical protein FPV67DRAFT_1777739 [Lyophyllum atratum]|nr:hypothetical protein FPV67DRAFT_1777739 [Lyophyllum atratum]